MKSHENMKILVVDDSNLIRRQVKNFLTSGGYRDIEYAKSADEAFSILGMTKSPFTPAPVDLVLMDIQMEGMNGIEATLAIKAKKTYKHVPILIITALDTETNLEKAFQAGAVDYIAKPLKKIELLVRVKSFLQLRQERIKRKEREQDLINLAAELRKANKALSLVAESDGLTGIPNRRAFDQVLDQEWRRASRNANHLSLLMIDIDHFKFFNDNYGHLQGDHCLQAISQQMSDALQRPADFLARYGGEEFAAVLPETDSSGATHIAKELRKAVQKLAIAHDFSPVSSIVTVSIGIATTLPGKDDTDVDTFINMADQALYQAKSSGRNRYHTFTKLIQTGTELLAKNT